MIVPLISLLSACIVLGNSKYIDYSYLALSVVRRKNE